MNDNIIDALVDELEYLRAKVALLTEKVQLIEDSPLLRKFMKDTNNKLREHDDLFSLTLTDVDKNHAILSAKYKREVKST